MSKRKATKQIGIEDYVWLQCKHIYKDYPTLRSGKLEADPSWRKTFPSLDLVLPNPYLTESTAEWSDEASIKFGLYGHVGWRWAPSVSPARFTKPFADHNCWGHTHGAAAPSQRDFHHLRLHKDGSGLKCPACGKAGMEGNGWSPTLCPIHTLGGTKFLFYERFKHAKCGEPGECKR